MIVVFWLRPTASGPFPESYQFEDHELTRALKFMEWLRGPEGMLHVTYSAVNGDCITKPGVDSVEDGKLPSGEEYEWSKAGRAGKIRHSERVKWAEEADLANANAAVNALNYKLKK